MLVQRSKYFQGLLLGGGTGMADGHSKTLTVELEDEQGAFALASFHSFSSIPPSFIHSRPRHNTRRRLLHQPRRSLPVPRTAPHLNQQLQARTLEAHALRERQGRCGDGVGVVFGLEGVGEEGQGLRVLFHV